jgi:pyruvate kinase
MPTEPRRAKIVSTLGPASASDETFSELLAAGVDVVRFNLSHGDHDWHREQIERVRRLAATARRHVPVVLDLMGPRYRLGQIDGKLALEAGSTVVVGMPGEGVDLPVDSHEILPLLREGERMLIDQGLVELEIEGRQGDRVTARVLAGGTVSTRKGINLPDTDIGFEITEKDRGDIAFAVAEGVDYLAASYVARAADLHALRGAVAGAGGSIPLIAKLERSRALDNIEEIVAASDAVMVARGDLGVEVPLHRVPVLQKRIIAYGRRAGKPVIVATQMLESMMEQPRPTRAEATDVANAVIDGADALMLSGETAAGDYPVETVATMARIVGEAESYQRRVLGAASDLKRSGSGDGGEQVGASLGRLDDDAADIADMVSAASVYSARELAASRLVAFTQSGYTGRLIARYRPSTPIVVFTPEEEIARQLGLVWGVEAVVLGDELTNLDEVIQVVDRELLARRMAEPGEVIVLIMGAPIPERRQPNLMRVHRVRGKSRGTEAAAS